MSGKSFMLIAGEASGDTLGAELVKALRAAPGGEQFRFFGAGGPKLAAAGARIELDLASHAVVGIWEVLKNYGKFKGFFDQLLNLAAREQPDFVILIDYPGFNLRFAKALKRRTSRIDHGKGAWRPKIVYYVSPQIWAWHQSRVHQIARDVDLMLAIFPFEKAWYAARRPELKVEFVGHPLIDRYAEFTRPEAAAERTLLLLPGSRKRELRQHLPVMVPAARRLAEERGIRLEMVLPDPSLLALAGQMADLAGLKVRVGGLAEALSTATVAIASSGTVTMECAYFGVPTVVIYKTSWSTYRLGRHFIKVNYLAMPNLLAEEEIYPELIQSDANVENICRLTRELLDDSERRSVLKARLQHVIGTLGERGASARAARAILDLQAVS